MRVPGDKSISHRAILIGAAGFGTMDIANLSPAIDVASSVAAVRLLGVRTQGPAGRMAGPPDSYPPAQLEERGDGTRVEGLDCHILGDGLAHEAGNADETDIHVGNSGTTIRILLGILAGAPRRRVTVDGDASIRRRPMARVVDPLRQMGANIEVAPGGVPPLHLVGTRLRGIRHTLPVASAQVKSALLLAGLRATGETAVLEPRTSRDHTERMLKYLGVPIDMTTEGLIVKSTNIQNASVTVPGDLSSAAFFLVAAAIMPGSRITIRDVGLNPTRAGIIDVLRAYGARITLRDEREVCGEPIGTIELEAGAREPVVVSGELTLRTIDELPLVGVLGAFAEGGVTEVRDAAELRVKESDRVATTVAALHAFGASTETLPDGFVVRGAGRVTGAHIDPAGDHRIAMAAAVAALGADGPTTIEGWDCTGVSYPGFEADLDRAAERP